MDFVIHGSAGDGTSGPAATWAQSCVPGDPVGLLDEGIGFNPGPGLDRVLLVADESGLPAAAGVLAALPAQATGHALIEVPSDADRQDLVAPPGVTVEWIVRTGDDQVPGRAALATATEVGVPDEPFYGWVVGEQALASTVRRNWVRAGVPKQNVMFCGYWRAGR